MEAKLIKMDILPKAGLESLDSSSGGAVSPQPAIQSPLPPSPTSAASPPSPPSPPSPSLAHCLDDFNSCGALLLSQKLRNLELQTKETEVNGARRSALDLSCLLTPPNTPHNLELVELEKDQQAKRMRVDGEMQRGEAPWSSGVDLHEEGGLVSECLAALTADCLKSDCGDMKRIVELKEEEEEEEEEEVEPDDDEDDDVEEVFSLELERGQRGLGLALFDAKDTLFGTSGIFIRAVVPDSPAARCEKLAPGDRILAVNGISLLGLDYHRGKEVIQGSGDRPRLLVARNHWMLKLLKS